MSLKLLQNAYRQLQKEPVEGFCVEPNESNFFEWKIYIEGPTGTPYQGGIFEMEMTFPQNFPMSPPELRFISEFWHPNVYKDGRVCISILHPPGEDIMSGELPEERWLPTQTVETIILSVLSIVGDPNFSSPANVDASVQCQHKHSAYVAKCRSLVEKAKVPSHIKIPHPESNPAERQKALERHRLLNETTPDDFMMDSDNDFDYDIDYGDDYEDMSGSDIGFNYDDVDDEDVKKSSSDDKKSSMSKKKVSEKKHGSESKSKGKESAKKEKKTTHKKKDGVKRDTDRKPKDNSVEKSSTNGTTKNKKEKTEKKDKKDDKNKSDSQKKSTRSPKTIDKNDRSGTRKDSVGGEKSKKTTHKSKESKINSPPSNSDEKKETKKKKPSG